MHSARFLRAWAWQVRGACAIAAAQAGREAKAALEDADRARRALARERMPWCDALGTLLYAGILAQRGAEEAGYRQLERAARQFDGLDMRLTAKIARWYLGRHIGGTRGADLVAEGAALMARQGIVDPQRFARMFVPGFGR
jgi:hypothetical protein